jgi:hypothetical protein
MVDLEFLNELVTVETLPVLKNLLALDASLISKVLDLLNSGELTIRELSNLSIINESSIKALVSERENMFSFYSKIVDLDPLISELEFSDEYNRLFDDLRTEYSLQQTDAPFKKILKTVRPKKIAIGLLNSQTEFFSSKVSFLERFNLVVTSAFVNEFNTVSGSSYSTFNEIIDSVFYVDPTKTTVVAKHNDLFQSLLALNITTNPIDNLYKVWIDVDTEISYLRRELMNVQNLFDSKFFAPNAEALFRFLTFLSLKNKTTPNEIELFVNSKLTQYEAVNWQANFRQNASDWFILAHFASKFPGLVFSSSVSQRFEMKVLINRLDLFELFMFVGFKLINKYLL